MQSYRFDQTLYLERVEETMERFVIENTNDEQLKESMLYSIRAGGKRIRPLLILKTLHSFSYELTTATHQIAAALEMIHTYSLIHDDLPAMDNDDFRRGKPTNHRVYGEALAILAGDGLLNLSFQLVSEALLPAEKKIQILQLLAKHAGTSGMIAGQAADIQAEKQDVALTALEKIHSRKTGALIRFAVVSGGILAEQEQYILELLDCFAQHLGVAFQIKDDILDVISTKEVLGKETQKDEALQKSTYPKRLGLDGAKKALVQELQEAENVLTKIEEEAFDSGPLLEVIKLFAI